MSKKVTHLFQLDENEIMVILELTYKNMLTIYDQGSNQLTKEQLAILSNLISTICKQCKSNGLVINKKR